MSVKDDIDVAETEPKTPLIVEEQVDPTGDEPSEVQSEPAPTPTPPPVEAPPVQPPKIETDAEPKPLDPPTTQTPSTPPPPKVIVHAPPPKRKGPPALELKSERSAGVLVTMRGGLVAYTDGGASDKFRVLNPGDEISVGEKLETWGRGRAMIQFADSSLLYIGEQSSVLIEKFSYLPEDPEASHLLIRLIDGDARLQAGSIGKYSAGGLVIKSRMMKVAVPHADVAVHSLIDGDEIAALGLDGRDPILVTTTRTGQTLHDAASGKQLVTKDSDLVITRITDSNKRVTVADGFPARAAPMSLSSVRHFGGYTTFYPEAEYRATLQSIIADIEIGRERLDTSSPLLRP
jgi:hypothetical protein